MDNKIKQTSSLVAAQNAVEIYKEKMDNSSYAGTLIEQVYELFGMWKWEDYINDYSDCSVQLLTALAKPEFQTIVEKEIGNYRYSALVEMLSGMIEFCKYMQKGNFSSMLLLYELKEHSDRYNEERLALIALEYSLLSKGITSYSERKEMLAKEAV